MNESKITDGARFHDSLASSWNSGYRQGGFRRRFIFTKKFIAPIVHVDEHWLDAGCGAGILTLELSKLGACGLSVDGSAQMINAAITEIGPLTNRFAFKKIDSISSTNIAAMSFDGILCASVVEYVENVNEVFAEFHRILKPGGKLILSVPIRNSPVRRAQKLVRGAGLMVGLDFFSYLSVSINDFLSAEILHQLDTCGFRILRSEYFDPIVPEWLGKALPRALCFVLAEKTQP